MIVSRADLEASLAELRASVAEPREGILGPRSVAWQVGGDLAVFLGGGRAALLQLAHPKVAHAIDQHSDTRTNVAGRFHRTFRNVFAMIFGDLDAAFAAARRVHAVHAKITGTIPDALGAWPAGTPYHANDPETLRWVHATLVDSVLVVRTRLDGPLEAQLADAYVREMNRFAALFAIPAGLLPTNHAEHAAYVAQMLASDQLAVAPCARDMARFLIGRGGLAQPPLGRITEALTASLLPPDLADAFGLRPSAIAGLGLDALGPIYRRLPARAVAIPARSAAERRLTGRPPSRVAAWTERRLFGLARQATGT
jgi:uncharacterized protein (DUF2236 family)